MSTGSSDTPAHSSDELRRLVAEGRESGAPVDGEAAFRRLRKKYAAMSARRDSPRRAE